MKKTNTKPTENAIVAMSNDAVPLIRELKYNEARIFFYCMAHYDSRNSDNYVVTAFVNDLRKFFDISDSNVYGIVRDAMLNLSQYPLTFMDDGDIVVEHWITGFRYSAGKGKFSFKINKDAEPYFLKLREFFTRFPLRTIKRFRSVASIKLYINLKQRANIGHWRPDLPDLKYRMGVGGKYRVWNNFRARVLEGATNEINKHSDLSVTWGPVKAGRPVVGVAFKIRKKADIASQNAREIHDVNKMLDEAKNEDHQFGDCDYVKPLPGQKSLNFSTHPLGRAPRWKPPG